MRIAFVTTETIVDSFEGGLANYLNRICIALRNYNHEPVVFVGSNEKKTIKHNNVLIHFIKYRPKNNILKKISYLSIINTIIFLYCGYKLNKKLWQEHCNNKFDIVQYTSLYGLAIFRKKIPSVIRISSYTPLLYYSGRKYYSNYINYIQKKYLEFAGFKIADASYAPSNIIAKSVSKTIYKKVDVIPTPFFIEEINYDYSVYNKFLKEKKYILFFGRIEYLKGLDILSKIIFNFFKKNQDFYFVMVGYEPPTLKKKSILNRIRNRWHLKTYKNTSLINKIKISAGKYKHRVIHIDKIPHNKLYPIIKNSEFVVLPSLMDNLPNACLEAMALKKIVIGTSGASFEDIITDGVNGFLYKKNDPIDLLKKINYVIKLKNKFEIEKNAYKRIKDFAPEKKINVLIMYYKRIINRYIYRTSIN